MKLEHVGDNAHNKSLACDASAYRPQRHTAQTLCAIETMKDHWSFDKKKYIDESGEHWLFVWRSFIDESVPYEERPVEIYFRNALKTYFGGLRIEHSKDNPYRYEKLVEKVIRGPEFREEHHSPGTEEVWSKNWK